MSDLIDGFNLGAGIIDRYAQQKQTAYANTESARRFQIEEAQREKAQADATAIAKANVEIDARRSEILNQQRQTETEIQSRMFQLDQQRREQRSNDLKRLVELDKQTSELTHGVVGPAFLKQSLDLWSDNLDLLNSDDAFIKSQAEGLKQRSEKAWTASAGYRQVQRLGEAIGAGLLSPEQKDNPDAQRQAAWNLDLENLRTEANSHGVDLADPRYAGEMKRIEPNQLSGGMADSSKARLRAMIEREVQQRAALTPDRESKFTFEIGPRDENGKPGASLSASAKDVLVNPAIQRIAFGALAAQGKDPEKLFGIRADENNVPRIERNGVTWRWSQAAGGKYIEYFPVKISSTQEEEASGTAGKPNHRSWLGNIVQGIFGGNDAEIRQAYSKLPVTWGALGITDQVFRNTTGSSPLEPLPLPRFNNPTNQPPKSAKQP